MRFRNPLTSCFAFGLAFCITASSMYATVHAATQDGTEPVPPAPIQFGEEVVPAAELLVAAEPTEMPSIDPESVLHDRQHHITLDANGGFNGRLSSLQKPGGNLSSASGMVVKVVQHGAALAVTTTNEEGAFSFTGLNEGVVALIAYGEGGLLLYSVRLVREDEGFADATPVKAETLQLGLSSAVVSSSDVDLAKQLILGGLPEKAKRFTVQQTEMDEAEHAFPYGTQEPSTSLIHHAVRLRADGALVGEVNLLDPRTGRHREIVDLTLHFLRDGEHIGATEVTPEGRFVMMGLAPGVHSIVTTGDDGILAMGIDILGSVAAAERESKYKFASIDEELELVVCPINAENFNQQNAAQLTDGTIDPASPGGAGSPVAGGPPVDGVPMAGFPGGGAPGGLGGGGAGVGGGGGLDALLAAGAAGAIGYAIGNDNEPASPGR